VTLAPQDPEILPRLIDVLDYRPPFEVVGLTLPIGLPDSYRPGGRTCDRQARRLLGPKRGAAVLPAPSRAALGAEDFVAAMQIGGVSAATWVLMPKIREVASEIQPYWQRTVFEVHPELTFYQLNEDQPLRYPKDTSLGRKERCELLVARLPGVERIIDAVIEGIRAKHLIDAAAALWTARRIASRAIARIPEDPEWDSQGIRMEIVR
jgi:predicted RNase H-like nuclease